MATVLCATSELHVHLEGSLEPALLCRLDPTLRIEEARALYRFDTFLGFLDGFKAAVRRLQCPEHYALAAQELFARLAGQGITYAEVILSAGVVLWKRQSLDEVWAALREAAARAPLRVRWIADTVRQFGDRAAEEVAQWAARCAGQGLVAFGIGGDETGWPAADFARSVAIAREAGLRFVPHAGETSDAANVWEMVRLGADRIGHGIRAASDAELMALLRDRQIALEICPTSNVRTGAVASFALHPLRTLFDAGVPVTLNSDDPAIFGTDLPNEFQVAVTVLGFREDELRAIAANADRYAFAR